MTSVAIVGAGFGGIGTAISLRRAGFEDITVLERGERVGGVWNQNTYPGAACDVPSHLYSYSFARNPRWGRRFALQPEIQRYVEDVARRPRRAATASASAPTSPRRLGRGRPPAGAFETSRRRGRGRRARVRLRPADPRRRSRDLPGLERFAGPAFHSSHWRHDVDLRGLRVGVIGSGASAIQFVPAIQPLVGSLTVVQRTPPWILPKPDRAYRPFDTALFERLPLAQLAGRFGFWAFLEAGIAGFIGHERAMRPLAAIARAHLRRQVRDPELRRQAHPDLQDGMQARAAQQRLVSRRSPQPNVEVVTEGVSEVDRDRRRAGRRPRRSSSTR